jgi:hypothetical protein
MKYDSRFGIKIFLLIGWTILVLWRFFYHFQLVNLGEIILNGLVLVILLIVFTALGRRALRHFQIEFSSFAEEWALSFGIGSGLIILLILGLAVLGGLYEVLIVSLLLTIFFLVYKDVRDLCIRGYKAFSTIFFRGKSVVNTVFLFLLGFACVATFLAAATPPFFFDALEYHLAVPYKYLLQHGFHYVPHHHASNFPMNLGMLFLVGMSFSGGMLAQLISWSFAPMTAIAVYGFTKSRWGAQVALIAATIIFLVPGVLILSTLTSVDIGVMFYSFLGFSALLNWFSSRQKSWFVLSGIFCSLAVGTKYTAILMTFLVIEIILFIHECFVKKRSLFAGLQKMLLLGLIVLCGASPWLIKNSIYTENPIYPLLNSLFSTIQASQHMNYDQYLSTNSPIFTLFRWLIGAEEFRGEYWLNLLRSFLRAPWSVTMQTTRAAGKTGALFLLCLPGIFLLKKLDPSIRYLLAIAGCSFWLWVVLLPHEALRYVFQMFPPLSIVTAYIFWNFPFSHRGKKWVLGGVSLILLYHLLMFFGETSVLRPFNYLFGQQTKTTFLLEHGVNYYPVIHYANSHLPADSKLLFVAEVRGYYCEKDYLLATNAPFNDQEKILRQLIIESQNVEEVIRKLQHMGITHILVNWSEMKRLAKEPSQEAYFDFPTEKGREIQRNLFSSQYLRHLISRHQVDLYEVLYHDTP